MRGALRQRRVQVPLALLVAAAVCAYAAAKFSGDELSGAYAERASTVLAAAAAGFAHDLRPGDLGDSLALHRRLALAREIDDRLLHAGVYRHDRGRLVRVASIGRPFGERTLVAAAAAGGRTVRSPGRAGSRRLTRVAVPLHHGGRQLGVLELVHDRTPAMRVLAERNRRFAIVLGALLLSFAAFTAFVLGRGVFRPLERLRVATQRIRGGDLDARLQWRRRDELGILARDFDAMAAELQEKHRRLEALAHEDPLTGLSNHRHLHEVLVQHVERAERTGTTLALAVLDLDGFKHMNDSRGHPFGDAVLQRVGRRLRAALGEGGVAARLGGDEFALLIPGGDAVEAYGVCERVRAAIATDAPQGSTLSCSAGVACFPADAHSAPSLLQLADGALFWAKQSGGRQTRIYDPEHVLVVTDEERAEFERSIARHDAVRAVFQPIVSLGSGEVVGYEALARFDREPVRPPSWWFAQAYRFGLGHRLEAEAVSIALGAQDRPPGTSLTINLSPSALVSSELQAVLPDDLAGIVIEITEHERIGEDAELEQAFADFRRRGARIAVDDAGAGYAGLQQVMRIRADLVKLDRAIVQGVHADPVKVALIESFVRFASTTGAEVCAEGIETLEDLRTLAGLGVAYGQGYVLARPAPPWAGVDAEAAAACRELARSPALVVPLERQRRAGLPDAGSVSSSL